MKKGIFIFSVIFVLIAALAGWIYYRYYFVFGEGVKSGELNYVVKKGVIFKTYEGKLIQSGLKSNAAGKLQSNEFIFSVENDSIANILMLNSGETYQLHYSEYNATLPWRGYSRYVVDGIIK